MEKLNGQSFLALELKQLKSKVAKIQSLILKD